MKGTPRERTRRHEQLVCALKNKEKRCIDRRFEALSYEYINPTCFDLDCFNAQIFKLSPLLSGATLLNGL